MTLNYPLDRLHVKGKKPVQDILQAIIEEQKKVFVDRSKLDKVGYVLLVTGGVAST